MCKLCLILPEPSCILGYANVIRIELVESIQAQKGAQSNGGAHCIIRNRELALREVVLHDGACALMLLDFNKARYTETQVTMQGQDNTQAQIDQWVGAIDEGCTKQRQRHNRQPYSRNVNYNICRPNLFPSASGSCHVL